MGQKLRHQITIWIEMNEKRNMRIMIMSYVKNANKKFINGIIIIAQVVMIRKLIVVNKIVWIMENVNHVLKRIRISVGAHLVKLRAQMLEFLRSQNVV